MPNSPCNDNGLHAAVPAGGEFKQMHARWKPTCGQLDRMMPALEDLARPEAQRPVPSD